MNSGETIAVTDGIVFPKTSFLLGIISPVNAMALLVFCLLYTPCVAAIASIKRELGGKWALLVILLQCSIAWVAAVVVNLVGGIIF